MSGVSAVGNSSAALQMLSAQHPAGQQAAGQQAVSQRTADGDTPAQEAMESRASKQAEKLNGGYAPNSAGLVDKSA